MTKDKYIFGKKTSRKQIVNYCYNYKGHNIIYRFSLPVKEGANKAYYTGLVDKQVAELAKSGKLEKHAKSYIRKMTWLVDRKGITIGVAATVVVVAAVTTAVLVTYFNHFHTDNVIFESETLTIDKTTVTLHRDADFAFGVNDFYAGYGYYLPDEVDQVAVNGVTLTADQYTYSNGHLKIAAEYMTGTVYIAAEANYQHFETDSWENIIKYANKGLDDLFIRYGCHSVVGLEHDLEFGNGTIKARVIGEGHDRLVDENGNPTDQAASLTFQIVLNENVKYDEEADATYYAESTLKTTCDEILNQLPDNIKDQVKEVDKYTSTYTLDKEHSVEKVFPLSLREINGANPYIDERRYNLYYSHEESPYEYYLEQDEDKLNEIRTTGELYWLRTPYVDASHGANVVTNKGRTTSTGGPEFGRFMTNPQDNAAVKSLVVAFAIGETESFITDKWENVATVANSGLEALKKYYGKESFVGLEREIKLDNSEEIMKFRVVGENHDVLADSDEHVAALTFEACYTAPSIMAYGENYASYSNSKVRSAINDNFFVNNIPLEVKRGIPLVKKISAGTKPDGEELYVTVMEETEDHVFILSLRELGDVWFSLAEPYSLEEKAYDYYRMPINSLEEINRIDHLRIKGANNYWTRSANPLYRTMETTVTAKTGEVMYFYEGAAELNKTDITEYCAYAPAFGFGVSNRPITFETDSWDNVCYYALQGLDVLKSHYDLRTFIGATREVTFFEGTDREASYNVRVIGENQDIDINGNKAPLTFEFTTTIAQRNITGDPFEGEYYSKDAVQGNLPTWSTSDLRSFCNDEVLPLLPTALKSSIRSVVKNTVVYHSETDKTIETTEDKLFPLSRNEISNDYSSSEPTLDVETFKRENETYQYYIDAPSYLLQKQDGEALIGYWLRSPTLQQSETANLYRAFGVTDVGNVQDNGKITERRGVAPAFAI